MPSKPRPQIVCYPSEQQHKELQHKAEQQGMSLSGYLIFVGMNAEIKVEVKKRAEESDI